MVKIDEASILIASPLNLFGLKTTIGALCLLTPLAVVVVVRTCFPSDEKQRQAWTKAVQRANWVPSKYSTLCSAHFSEDQIDRTSRSCVRLRENAVPNVFSGFPGYFQKEGKNKNDPVIAEMSPICDINKLPKNEVISSADEASPEYILPECDSPVGSDESECDSYSEYSHSKTEPHSSPVEVCTKSTQTEIDYPPYSSDSFTDEECIQSNTKPYSSHDDTYVELNQLVSGSPLSSVGADEHSGAETDPSLSYIVGSEHQYSNSLSPKVLKQKLELACSYLVEAKKKLKVEQQRNRRARRTISRLKCIISDLQLHSLSH